MANVDIWGAKTKGIVYLKPTSRFSQAQQLGNITYFAHICNTDVITLGNTTDMD